MSTTRRRISIHDYPEHLNPFSENHLTFQDKRKILADKLRKNSTWSSKISKRLSRSVSWLEKSWLTAEDSHKKNCSSQICDKVHEPTYRRPELTNIGLTRPRSYLDIRHQEDNPPNPTQITKNFEENQTLAAQNSSKPEPKRRKKRPAPLPPISDTKSDSNENVEISPETSQLEGDDGIQLHITSTDTTIAPPAATTTTTTVEQNANAYPNGRLGDEEVTKTCRTNSIAEPAAVTHHEVSGDGNGDGHKHVPFSTPEQCDGGGSCGPSTVTHGSPSDQPKNGESRSEDVRHVPASASALAEEAAAAATLTQQKQPTEACSSTGSTISTPTTDDHNQSGAIQLHLEEEEEEQQQESQTKHQVTSTQSTLLPAQGGGEEPSELDENANVTAGVAAATAERLPAVSNSNAGGGLSTHCNGKAIAV